MTETDVLDLLRGPDHLQPKLRAVFRGYSIGKGQEIEIEFDSGLGKVVRKHKRWAWGWIPRLPPAAHPPQPSPLHQGLFGRGHDAGPRRIHPLQARTGVGRAAGSHPQGGKPRSR